MAQDNSHRPTSDFIGPISISNFTFSVFYMANIMHERIWMVKNTWKAISHLSGYTFNQITIFIEVACIKRKIHAQILMDQRETSKGKIKKINLKVPLQPMDRKRRIDTAHTSIQRILIWNTGKLSTMHASTMNTSSRLFKAAGLRWRRPLILGSRWDLSAWSQWAAKVNGDKVKVSEKLGVNNTIFSFEHI